MEFWIYKGRIVYRGDNAKDQTGAAAVYQELGASPTTVHTANTTIAYGAMSGFSTQTSDAQRAYIQAALKSKHETWVEIPPELRPPEWGDKYVRPMCRLVKALYGHPEAGGHWERHLTQAVKWTGGEPSREPSK